jgi:transposase-like protein
MKWRRVLNEIESRNTKNVIQVASKLFEDYINNLCDKFNEEIVQRNIVPCPKFDKNLTSIGQYF